MDTHTEDKVQLAAVSHFYQVWFDFFFRHSASSTSSAEISSFHNSECSIHRSNIPAYATERQL
jgi:hypothetical protein